MDNVFDFRNRLVEEYSAFLLRATAGCILRQWSADCSPDHSLRGYEFRLWLKDHLALCGVKNAVLAPGYRSPDQNKGKQ